MKKDTNTNALFEKLYECGSGQGMKPIGFFLDGQSLTVNGNRDGTKSTPEVHLKLTLKNNGSLAIEEKKEIGFDLDRL
jgi:hypothetical protein